jgi:hypothetical protein
LLCEFRAGAIQDEARLEGDQVLVPQLSEEIATAAAVCSGMLQTRMSPPVHRARSARVPTFEVSPAASITENSPPG